MCSSSLSDNSKVGYTRNKKYTHYLIVNYSIITTHITITIKPMLIFFIRTHKCIVLSIIARHQDGCRSLKSFLMDDRGQTILCSQYHDI